MFRASLLAIVFATAALPASAAIDLAAQIPVGPQVKVGKLPNGLAYYIQRNGKPAKRLELRLVVKAGSVLEDDDQQGLAHMLEHVVFGSSAHMQKHELISYLQSIGLKIGADMNAYTSYDETVYMLPVPTGNKANVDKAFTVLQDWAQGVTTDEADIDKERPIVLEEKRRRLGAGERVRRQFLPLLYNGSRYADRQPIGKEEVISTAKAEALRRFYHDWYRPDLMAVIVVGDIDPQEAETMIKAHFAGLVNPAQERPRTYVDIPPRTQTHAVALTDPEAPGNELVIRYPARYAPYANTYGGYRDKMIERLADMMLNGRLTELAQQPNPPFINANGATSYLTSRYRNYATGVTLGTAGATPALTAVLQEQQRARQYGFLQVELERAGKSYLRNLEHAYTARDTTDSGAYAAEYQRNFLANESISGVEAEYKLAQELLPGIKLEELNAAARKAYPADAAKLVVYAGGAKGAPAPTDQQLLADIAAAAQTKVAAHEEKALTTQLMERPAKPGTIVEESRDDKLGLTRLTLSNGVKVILKPTTFRKDQVLLGAQRYGGQSLFDAKDLPNVRQSGPVVGAMGLGDFSPADMHKIMAGRSAAVTVALGNYTDTIGGASGASADNVETMLQFLWLRFHGVRRDEGLYKTYMGKQEELVRNRLAAPEARFSDAITDALYGGHPYEPRATTSQDLAKVDLDGSVAAYRQRFSSAKGLTFVLVGDFDVAALKPLLAAYLGTLPVTDLPLDYRDVGLRYAKGVIKKEVRAGTEPKSIVALTFTGPATWSPVEALRMQALVEVMNLRVFEVLREKRGLIYSGGLSGSLSRIPDGHYQIGTALPTAPEKVDQLVAALFEETARMKAEGPTQAELDKFKANWRQSHARQLQENAYWLGGLEATLVDGTDPQRLLTIEEDVNALSPADVQAAARRYFDQDNYVQVVMNPEVQVKTAKAGGE